MPIYEPRTSNGAASPDEHSIQEFCGKCPPEKNCCYRASVIIFLPDEYTRIEAEADPSWFTEESGGIRTIRKSPGEPCPFLTEDNLCRIYTIRPTDCRSWPLTIAHNEEKTTGFFADHDCPAIRSGGLRPEEVCSLKTVLVQITPSLKPTYAGLVRQDVFSLVSFPLDDHADTHHT